MNQVGQGVERQGGGRDGAWAQGYRRGSGGKVEAELRLGHVHFERRVGHADVTSCQEWKPNMGQ